MREMLVGIEGTTSKIRNNFSSSSVFFSNDFPLKTDGSPYTDRVFLISSHFLRFFQNQFPFNIVWFPLYRPERCPGRYRGNHQSLKGNAFKNAQKQSFWSIPILCLILVSEYGEPGTTEEEEEILVPGGVLGGG